jgi:hypothetical protein
VRTMAPSRKEKPSASKKKNAPSASLPSKKKNAPSALTSFLKNKSNKGVSALVVQHSEDWQMKVAARFMGVRNKKEELLDPHTIQQQLQQANSKRANAWKVVEGATNACTTLAEQEILALTATCHSLKKQLEMTQEFIKDAREVKWFAKKGYERHQEDDPLKAFHYLNLFKQATAVDITATVYEDKFAHAELAAEKYAKEQSAASENQVAEDQAVLEAENDEAASDESEPENGDLDKVHDQFCKAQYHPTMRKRKPRNVSNGRLTPDNQARKQKKMKASLDTFMETKLRALDDQTPNEAGELFKFETGLAICIVCNNKHVTWATLARHIGGKTHKDRKAAHKSAGQQVQMRLQNIREFQGTNELQGQTLSNHVTKYRARMLNMFCKANIPIAAADTMDEDLAEVAGDGRTLGGPRGLSDLVQPLHAEHIADIKQIASECYPEYSLIVDGSPLFAEAVAVKIRLVHKSSFKIVELLVKCKLYTTGLNGENTAGEILEVLEEDIKLPIEHWVAFMMDRASTNVNAIKIVRERTKSNPHAAPCCAHGMSNTGKEIKYPHGKELLNLVGLIVKFSLSKSRVEFLRLFHEQALRGGGVRWYLFYERAKQIVQIGMQPLSDFVDSCVAKGYSKESSKKLREKLDDFEFVANAFVELAAVVDAGTPLCVACYKLEGDQPLILVASDILDPVKQLVLGNRNDFKWTELEKAAKHAEKVMKDAQKPHDDAVKSAEEAANAAAIAVIHAQDSVQSVATRPGAAIRQRRERANVTYATGQPVANEEAEEFRLTLEAANVQKAAADAALSAAIERRDQWQEGKRILAADWIQHGKENAAHAFNYFNRQFLLPDGAYFNTMECFKAASLFNPLKMKGKTLAEMEALVDQLVAFSIGRLQRWDFREYLKKELPRYLGIVNSGINWNTIDEEAIAYDKKEDNTDTWKSDESEVARRVWTFWVSKRSQFNYMTVAVALIILVQTSSAAVERVFSQLKLIIDACGQNSLSDLLELRLFRRLDHKTLQELNKLRDMN